MKTYKDELIKSMNYLADKPNTIFVGQQTAYPGNPGGAGNLGSLVAGGGGGVGYGDINSAGGEGTPGAGGETGRGGETYWGGGHYWSAGGGGRGVQGGASPIGINNGNPGQIVVFAYKKSKFTV